MAKPIRGLIAVLLVGAFCSGAMTLMAGVGLPSIHRWYHCPNKGCLAPCIPDEHPQFFCRSKGGKQVWETTFECCCCVEEGRFNKYRPLY